MRHKRAIKKVTAFITRRLGDTAELLLLEHPMAGIQLPAGTVELNETLESAVRREIIEETGLERVRLVGELGQIVLDLPDNEGIVTRATKLFDAPASDASSVGGYGLTRGSAVEILRIEGGFVEVNSDPLDLGQSPPVRVDGVRGFVRQSLLTGRVERHLYHFTAVQSTPNSWQTYSDGVNFRLFWQSLVPKPALHPKQQPWLDQVYAQLKQETEAAAVE